jgi:hypothetical protein
MRVAYGYKALRPVTSHQEEGSVKLVDHPFPVCSVSHACSVSKYKPTCFVTARV